MTPPVDREKLAIELKTWLRSNPTYRTIRELEKPTGIPYSSLKDYFAGAAAPKGERLARLASLTGIPSLNFGVLPEMVNRSTENAANPPARDAALSVLAALRRLIGELQYFKQGSPDDRTVLRQMLPARDVGYVTTLLKAIYDENQFETWVYFADYKPEAR